MRRHNAINITSAASSLGKVAQPNQTLLINVAPITVFRCSFVHCTVCLVTGLSPRRKRIIQKVRTSASSLKFQYILFFLTPSCSCLHLLCHLLVTSIILSITLFRSQFLRNMWPIQLPVLRFIVCPFFPPCLYVILIHFLPDRSNWSPSYSSATFQNFQVISPLFSEVSKFQLCYVSFIWHCLSWCIGHSIFSVVFLSTSRGPGKWSRYSNSLRTRRFGHRIKGGGGEIFCTRPDRPWGTTPLPVQWVPGLIPESKAAGVWRWPSTPSGAEVKESVELYLSSSSFPSLQVLGWPLAVFLSTSQRTRAQNVRMYHDGFLPRTISHSQSILLRIAISAGRLINRCCITRDVICSLFLASWCSD